MDPAICERIKSHRKRMGLTQTDLGVLIGVQKSAIQKYESGGSGMKLDTLIQLANIFGVTVSSLVGEDLSDKQILELIYEAYGATGLEMFDTFKGLNPEGRLKVLGYAHDIQQAYRVQGVQDVTEFNFNDYDDKPEIMVMRSSTHEP